MHVARQFVVVAPFAFRGRSFTAGEEINDVWAERIFDTALERKGLVKAVEVATPVETSSVPAKRKGKRRRRR